LTRLLSVILTVWEPLNLALFVAPALTTIATRGYATAAFLFVRLLVAGIGVAAGLSLWRRDPHARALATVALVLSTAAGAVTFTTTLLPTSIVPGDEWIWLAAVVVFNGGWIAYLRWFYR
jgi:hypothetical protein